MAMIVAVPKEVKEGEHRVAMIPSVVEKITKMGFEVAIQKGLGSNIYLSDSAYQEKGAKIIDTPEELYGMADMVIKINPPTEQEVNYLRKPDVVLISFLYPHLRTSLLKVLMNKHVTSFAVEMIPRISRAQIMDVLSTQATVIGYKAVLLAANVSKFFFPMLATGAGTMRPAKVLIIGVGVAGLQAIATAKRLGARVEAYDVRPETKKEAESLGAKFVDTGVVAIGEGGYARDLTQEEKQQQKAVLDKHVAESDVVITTAGVPGRPAPKILTKEMVEKMKPGSVIVDTMAEMGGNCELTKAGEEIEHNQVTILGPKDLVSTLTVNASEMYAKNILNFVTPLFVRPNAISFNWEDEVLKGSVVTYGDGIMNPTIQKLLEG